MIIRSVEYSSEGVDYVGYFTSPDSQTGPAVLLAHGAPGINDTHRAQADRLAELGYVVLCADYVGGGRRLGDFETRPVLGAMFADPTLMRPRIVAALAALVAQPGVDPDRIGALGYCFGGTTVLELGRTGANLTAIVALHAALPLIRPEDNANIRAKILMVQGSQDPLGPPEMRTEFEASLDAAKLDWQTLVFGSVGHGFSLPETDRLGLAGMGYSAAADEQSWQATLRLFDETIGRP